MPQIGSGNGFPSISSGSPLDIDGRAHCYWDYSAPSEHEPQNVK